MNMGRLALPRLVFVTAALAAALLPPRPVSTQAKERFTGFAINMNSGPTTGVVDFTIDRWSTDEERDRLLAIVRENKDPTTPLLTALQKLPPVGRIRTSTSLGWDLHYAREFPQEEGGRRVVLGTDRPIGFVEARNSTRTMDYPFTIVEIHLDKDDKGEGKILAGTKIYVDKNNNLVLENYGQQPVRFNEIHRQK